MVIRRWLNQIKQDRRDAERYRRLRIMMSDAHRWLGGYDLAQAEAVIEWLQQGDDYHFGVPILTSKSKPRWSQDISIFRDELRKIYPNRMENSDG